ncbi:uncharacterized protein LY89DRAFT_375047 [Mollisia scopiformis]|uniref:Uncharacterized protein n=1 Tax=Mollisia scopiformis TaxID=149040 RepID=A0A132B443_MOLSC|nr:uncharacterized protein LY89DRAFT_375047 [Mollisia scopiformis]KUJ07003.1 hypothetical protein LY89DRAFT_375047 [Mollisia scopiformis]
MFRSSSRSQSDPVAASSEASQPSTWRPSLRGIKKGLFSNKDDPQSSKDPRIGTAATTGPPLSASLQEADAYLTRTTSFVSSGYGPSKASSFKRSQTTRGREQPRTSREPLGSKGFTLIKQSGSRSQRHRPTESQGGLLCDLVDLDQQETGPYIPKHAASDFSKSTRQKNQGQIVIQPSSTPYTPTHAASDFSKIKLAPKMADAAATPIQSRDAAPITPPAKLDDSNDYQVFLAAARQAAARTYNTTGVMSPNRPKPCPQVSQKMKEIVAKHQETVRQRATSVSQQSVASKPASIFDKVGEYIKPSRAESVYSQRTGYSDEKSSTMGSVTSRERAGRKVSRDKRSFS